MKRVLLLAIISWITGCASAPVSFDRDIAVVARLGGFEKTFLQTQYFALTAYCRFAKVGAPLNVYIEGDGCSWLNRSQLSGDPTPRNPLTLELAGIDPASNVVYLARPGQYTQAGKPLCDAAYWSNKRFSEEVIAATNDAISQLVFRVQADKINLIGYSGGAAVAVLVAARRDDIASVRTIAGNLNPTALNRYHKVSPLSGSLDPMEAAQKIKDVPQRHFVGSQDNIVPSFIAESFAKQLGDNNRLLIVVVDGVTHAKGWQKQWKKLLEYPLVQAW